MISHPQRKRCVVVRAFTATGTYSGGRLFAWILAEGFAAQGCEVVFWGDCVPSFVNDFAGYPGHARIRWHTSADLLPWSQCELFVIVPHLGRPQALFGEALIAAAQMRARVVLLNFESPNWFNALAPASRDPAGWEPWQRVARVADAIVSISYEGTRYAREFYTEIPQSCRFLTIHPAINSQVADRVEAVGENQVICLARFSAGNQHKGGEDVLAIIGPALQGHTLVLIVGEGGVPAGLLNRLQAGCVQYGVSLRLVESISDEQKFREIRKSKVLVFPSYFEGYGYPPVEALYCGVPCVAYDLPVLREVCGDRLNVVPIGDRTALAREVARLLAGPAPSAQVLKAAVAPRIEFQAFVRLLGEEFAPTLEAPPCLAGRATWGARLGLQTERFLDRCPPAIARRVTRLARSFRSQAKMPQKVSDAHGE